MPGPVEPDGATPLTWEEQQGLIPSWVTTRNDLNNVEQANIADALRWARGRRWTPAAIVDERALQRLHRRMFSDVWRWAGKYRTSDKNIGVPYWDVAAGVRTLLADTLAMLAADDHDTYLDEIAVRFHHRLVFVHPFANGNGRHSRLAADILAHAVGRPEFDWGGGKPLGTAGDLRRAYIDALRAADAHDIGPLLAFARSNT